jgi:hypothetical protein
MTWAVDERLGSWSGQVNNRTGGFQTLWFLTAASEPTWNGIDAGTDTFILQHSATR